MKCVPEIRLGKSGFKRDIVYQRMLTVGKWDRFLIRGSISNSRIHIWISWPVTGFRHQSAKHETHANPAMSSGLAYPMLYPPLMPDPMPAYHTITPSILLTCKLLIKVAYVKKKKKKKKVKVSHSVPVWTETAEHHCRFIFCVHRSWWCPFWEFIFSLSESIALGPFPCPYAPLLSVSPTTGQALHQ